MIDSKFWEQNDELHREGVSETLQYLVTGTYVCGVHGLEIEEITDRIRTKTMIGFELGFLGPWLPEWQFIKNEAGKSDVSDLAIEVWNAWGDFDQSYFIEVMATHTLENVPDIGEESTYSEMVKLGINPLLHPNTQTVFRDHGIGAM